MTETMRKIPTTLSNQALNIFHALKENQLYRINEPNPGIFIVESPVVIERALAAGFKPISFLLEKELLSEKIESILEPYGQVPQYVCTAEELQQITGYQMCKGMLAAFSYKEAKSVQEICRGKQRIVVLENVMNPTNVGAIIRSAAALNIEAVLLTKGCANPFQRRATRVSMGNVFSLPWTWMDTYTTDMVNLKEMGFATISMALSDRARSLADFQYETDRPLAIIMGTEGEGLAQTTIEASDYVVKIPMAEGVDSLNVAAASAVAFWALSR